MSKLPEANNTTNQQDDAFCLSRNPQKAIQEMMETIDTLKQVYEQENQALEHADADTFLALQDAKLVTARIYQERVREMLDRKDEMKNIDMTTKNKLADMQTQFSAIAKTNAELLERMKNAMNRLGNTIRKAAKEAARKQRTFSYDAKGTIKHGDNKSISTGISETV